MNGWKLILGSGVRNALVYLLGILAAHHIITKGQADVLPINDMVASIVGWLLVFGWSVWQKAVAKWKFLEALRASPTTHPETIADLATDAPAGEKVAALLRS